MPLRAPRMPQERRQAAERFYPTGAAAARCGCPGPRSDRTGRNLSKQRLMISDRPGGAHGAPGRHETGPPPAPAPPTFRPKTGGCNPFQLRLIFSKGGPRAWARSRITPRLQNFKPCVPFCPCRYITGAEAHNSLMGHDAPTQSSGAAGFPVSPLLLSWPPLPGSRRLPISSYCGKQCNLPSKGRIAEGRTPGPHDAP